MRKVVIQVSLMLAVLGAAFLGLFRREALSSLITEARLSAKGYKPAQSPEEALDRFRAAIRERDYEAAVLYCGGDYVEQIRKAEPGARVLGKSIDNLVHNVEQEGIRSDRVQLVLGLLEPFPREVKVYDLRKVSDELAYAVLIEESGGRLKVDGYFEGWQLDWRLIRSLARGLDNYVELRRVGTGKKACWKIFFPVSPELRECVDYLKDNASNLARSLDKVKYALKRDAATRSDLERELRSELEEACRY